MPLDQRTLSFYALPTAGVTAMHWLVMIYLLKFSTETLGLAPALVGTLFAAGRIWDAVSDPAAGWLSDRTRTKMGRRRPWMLAAAVPLALSFYALWSPPADLSGAQPAIWLGGFLVIFYTAATCFNIPHFSLGAELSPEHHERTRISAQRLGAEVLGMISAIGCLHFLESAAAQREVMSSTAALVGVVTSLLIVVAVLGLREPPAHQGRMLENPLKAFADVAKNPHALRITAALFLGELGLGSIMVAIPYMTDLGGESVGIASRMLGFIVFFALALPGWVALSKRFGKVPCWMVASALCAATFVSMGLVVDTLPVAIPVLIAMIGLSQAGMRVFPLSIKADVIDWDEAQTGERKEGTYFAVWNLTDKLAGSASVAIVGFAIQGAGGGIDLEGVKLVVSYIPAAFVALSALILWGFRLDANEHSKLRARIEARHRAPAFGTAIPAA